MGRTESMVELVDKLMTNRTNIRNIGTVAHIDHGKCVVPNTRIQLTDGRLIRADELYEETSLIGEKVKETTEETVFALKKPVEIFSVNTKTGKIEKKNISHAWKLKGGKIIETKLRTGNILSTTPEHKYLLFDGVNLHYKEAKELKAGERIVMPRNLSCESNMNIGSEALRALSKKPFYVFLKKEAVETVKNKLKEKGLEYFCSITKRKIGARSFEENMKKGRYLASDIVLLSSEWGISTEESEKWISKIGLKDSIKINWPTDWKELFTLAGLLIGDGSGKVFVVGKEELRKTFEDICLHMGFKPIPRNYPPRTFEFQTNETILQIMNSLFDYPLRKKSHNVRISDFVLKSPNYLVLELLKAYFDCDGTVEKARSAVSISSVSKQMISDLSLVLPRFGCVPIIGKENTIYITGESTANFVKNIGFSIKEKMNKAQKLSEKSTGSIVCDTVPCGGFKELRNELNKSMASINQHYYKYENAIYVPQRNTYRQIQAVLLKEKQVRGIDIEDLAFVEIKEIKEGLEETVYDFSVPENQNFVAQGMFVHNTTLSDSLIAAAGLINQDLAGKVQMMDYEDQEQDRGITINAANISLGFDWKNEKYLVNLIDTPGHVDFTGEVIRAMRAVDGVILLVDAVEGVMPQTETVIRQALREYVRPVLFINKVDRIIKELNANEQQMQEKFIKVISKVNTLIERNAPEEFKQEWQVSIQKGTVAFGSAKRKWGVSAQYMQKSGINFKQVYDYLKNDQQDELAKRSPVHEVVLQMVAEHLPSPLKAQKYRIKKIWGGDMEIEAAKSMTACSEKGPITMVVTDVSVDAHAGDVATGRVYSGTLTPGSMVHLLSAHREVKVQKVGVYMGNEFITINKAEAGNIAAIVGTKDIYAGETVATDKNIKPFESFMSNAEPVMTVSIEAKNPKDLPKLIEALRKLSKEDPNLRATINQETGEHLLSGMGELHLEVNTYRIVNNHKIEIQTSSPIVVFHEGILGESGVLEAKSPNKHNKFKLKVTPLPAEIYAKISEQTTPVGKIKFKNAESIAKLQALGFSNDDSKKVWAVEGNNALIDRTRGITALHEIRELLIQAFKDAMNEGPLAKEKCQGVLVELDDATLHEDSIHRGPAQVLPAVTRGIYSCMLQAGAMLFEPKQLLSVTVPEDMMGAASRELGGRRVQITEMRQEGDSSIIIGKAPVKELIGFSSAMRGATQGRAVWTAEYYGYELLPRDMQAATIKEIRKRKGMPEEIKTWQFFLE